MESTSSSEEISDSNTYNPTNSRLYKKVFNATADGVIILNADGKVMEANSAALEILRVDKNNPQLIYDSEFFRFHKIHNLQWHEIAKTQWPITRLKRNEHFENEQLVVTPKKNKSPIYLSFSGIPETDKNGKFNGGILIVRDIAADIEISHQLEENDIDQRLEFYNTLEHYQKELKGERQLLQYIIDSIPVMITIYKEGAGQIILNNAFVDITGWTNEDASKANIMELAYPEQKYRQEVDEFMKSESPDFKDIVMRTRDARDFETSWANINVPDGRRVGVGIDITARKKLENELIEARKKAEKENQIQSAFIQNISHEVRTPMNSILGYTELLRKQLENKKEYKLIDAISFNGKQLLRLINDIIDFSRLDKNKLSLEKSEVNVKQLVEQNRKQFSILKKTFNKYQLKLSTKFPDNLNKINLYTDEQRVQQVLSNLITNAIKYTEKGTVELGVEIREKEQNVLFYVKDSGIGISKVHHHRVFNRFNRFHDTTENEFRGTGLGLAICKHLVKLFKGKIWFESEEGKGSTFYFTHPFGKFELIPETTKKTHTTENYSLPDLTNRTILIVEDDSFSFHMMALMLEDTNATILNADNGKTALEVFEKENIDLIFLDIRLPEMNGFEVIKRIRETDKKIPVIAQTANVMDDDKKRMKKSGFNDLVEKPVNQHVLFNILNHYNSA